MFSRVTVVGAGQMGSGIAQVIAQKNIFVCLLDPGVGSLENARKKITSSLNKLYEKKLITLTPDEVLRKIHFVSEIGDIKKKAGGAADEEFVRFAGDELVIEAVPENQKLKQKVFKQISDVSSTGTIIVSNTSSIPLARLAEAVSHPERVAGLHFMNPVPLMKLVEVIRTGQTAEAVSEKLYQFTLFLDKVAVYSGDQPGFIVNRVLMPMINSAVFVLMDSVSKVEDIDKAMRLGCHHPVGPLALADLIGLDTCLSIMEVLEEGLGEKYAPCPLLKKYVKEGRLGKKSGKGFYTY